MARFNSSLSSNTITGASTIGSPFNGAFTQFTGTAPYTVTLPSPGLYPGINQTYYNNTSGIITLSSPSGTFSGSGGPGASTVSISANNVISLVSDGTNYIVISEDGSPLLATTGSFSSNVTMNGGSATVSITPSVVTIAPTASSTIDNIAIGSTTRASGAFTTLTANNSVTLTAATASSSTTTGSLVVTGGIGASGTVYAGAFNGNLTGTLQTAAQPNITSTGSLTIPGLTVDTTTLVVDTTNDRVGVGTNAPSTNLTVGGTAASGGAGGGLGVFLSRGVATNFYEAFDGTKSYIAGVDNTQSFAKAGTLSGHDLAIVTGNGAKIYIQNSTGNVGVGTSNPADTFQVQKDQNASTNMYVSNATAGTAARSRLIMNSDASAGNLSIGMHSSSHSAYPNQAWIWASGASTPIVLGTVGTPRVTIDPSGNVTMNTAGTTLTVPNQNSLKTTSTVYPTSRPNLVLDFANSKGVDARITFTRNSVGSYYDENGILRYAAANQPRIDYDPATLEPKGLLIEEARTNLITFSDHLSSYYWTTDGNGFIITNGGAVAPDGTMSADFIQEGTSATASPRFIKTNPWSTLSNTTFTFSLHVKTSGTKRNMFMLCQDSSQAFYAHFDIVAGTVVASNNSGTGVLSGAGIQNAGNGWFRIWISGRIPSTAIYTMATLSAVGATGFGATTYTGDGVSGFSVWGAQIEVGAFPTSYIQSTPIFGGRNSTATYFDSVGMLRTIETNRPRNHYVYNAETGQMSSVGLLIEAQKTNVATTSFSGYAGTKTTGQADPAGGSSAVLFSGTPPNNGYITGQPIATATAYCVSAFVKAGSSSQVNFGCEAGFPNGYSGVISYDISSGVIGTNANAKGYMRPVGNGWYRIWWVSTSTGTSATVHIASTGINAYGIQIETGTTPTSYIPTNTTRVADFVFESTTTRAVDNAVMFNMGSVLNSTQGTVISTWESQGAPTGGGVPGVFELLAYSGTGGIDQRTSAFYYGDNYALSTGGYTYNSGYTTRAIAYQSANTKIFINGSLTASNTVHTIVANLDKILLGGIDNAVASSYPLNGHIKRLVYYPKRLTDTEVIALTTQ